jgi:hypothetical protein
MEKHSLTFKDVYDWAHNVNLFSKELDVVCVREINNMKFLIHGVTGGPSSVLIFSSLKSTDDGIVTIERVGTFVFESQNEKVPTLSIYSVSTYRGVYSMEATLESIVPESVDTETADIPTIACLTIFHI